MCNKISYTTLKYDILYKLGQAKVDLTDHMRVQCPVPVALRVRVGVGCDNNIMTMLMIIKLMIHNIHFHTQILLKSKNA